MTSYCYYGLSTACHAKKYPLNFFWSHDSLPYSLHHPYPPHNNGVFFCAPSGLMQLKKKRDLTVLLSDPSVIQVRALFPFSSAMCVKTESACLSAIFLVCCITRITVGFATGAGINSNHKSQITCTLSWSIWHTTTTLTLSLHSLSKTIVLTICRSY